MKPCPLNPREFLAALNMACCMMGGTKDQFQAFCAGFATGMSATVEALDVGMDYYDPSVLGTEGRDQKILAGALSIISQFNAALEKDAVYEELAGEWSNRDEFRKNAMAKFSEFESKTRMAN